jgi:hypothetical protein
MTFDQSAVRVFVAKPRGGEQAALVVDLHLASVAPHISSNGHQSAN